MNYKIKQITDILLQINHNHRLMANIQGLSLKPEPSFRNNIIRVLLQNYFNFMYIDYPYRFYREIYNVTLNKDSSDHITI